MNQYLQYLLDNAIPVSGTYRDFVGVIQLNKQYSIKIMKQNGSLSVTNKGRTTIYEFKQGYVMLKPFVDQFEIENPNTKCKEINRWKRDNTKVQKQIDIQQPIMSIKGNSEASGTYFHYNVIKQVLTWVNDNDQIYVPFMKLLQIKYRLIELATPRNNHMGYKIYHIFNGISALNYTGKESGFQSDYYRKEIHEKEVNDKEKRWNKLQGQELSTIWLLHISMVSIYTNVMFDLFSNPIDQELLMTGESDTIHRKLESAFIFVLFDEEISINTQSTNDNNKSNYNLQIIQEIKNIKQQQLQYNQQQKTFISAILYVLEMAIMIQSLDSNKEQYIQRIVNMVHDKFALH